MTIVNIDPDSIITEGKLDYDLFGDPVMVYIDLHNDLLSEAEEDLFLDKAADVAMIDIVLREDPEFIKLDEEEPKFEEDLVVGKELI